MPETTILVICTLEKETSELIEAFFNKSSKRVLLCKANWNDYLICSKEHCNWHFLLVYEPRINEEIQKIIAHFFSHFKNGILIFANSSNSFDFSSDSELSKELLLRKAIQACSINFKDHFPSKELPIFYNKTSFSSKISEKEIQLIGLLANGKNAFEIANELSLSVRTIETYTRNLLQKLNLRNRPHLIDFAYKNGLLP